MVIRPVERGLVPKDKSGKPKIFKDYTAARGDLIDRIGEYCSYCEMRLGASLAVEHVLPKKHHPRLALRWDNFLLSCVNCNSAKGDKNIKLKDYYFPDRDNTARAFEYLEGGIVRVNPKLTVAQRARAQRTLKLTGLNRIPTNNPAASDRRWNNRREAWDIAQRALQRLQMKDTLEMREQIAEHARDKGYWSAWMTVFQGDSDMLKRFIAAFPGTCRKCFNSKGGKIRRPGGAL